MRSDFWQFELAIGMVLRCWGAYRSGGAWGYQPPRASVRFRRLMPERTVG